MLPGLGFSLVLLQLFAVVSIPWDERGRIPRPGLQPPEGPSGRGPHELAGAALLKGRDGVDSGRDQTRGAWSGPGRRGWRAAVRQGKRRGQRGTGRVWDQGGGQRGQGLGQKACPDTWRRVQGD